MKKMNIGERIKQRREELGLSVDDVAKMLGKHRATVYRYESDEIEKFPTNVLEPLAVVLQTTPSALMGWDDLLEEAKAHDEKVRALSQYLAYGITLTGKDNSELIFKDYYKSEDCFQNEKHLLLDILQINQAGKDKAMRTLHILAELVDVMSSEDQDKLVAFAEFMEAERQKKYGMHVIHAYQREE